MAQPEKATRFMLIAPYCSFLGNHAEQKNIQPVKIRTITSLTSPKV